MPGQSRHCRFVVAEFSNYAVLSPGKFDGRSHLGNSSRHPSHGRGRTCKPVPRDAAYEEEGGAASCRRYESSCGKATAKVRSFCVKLLPPAAIGASTLVCRKAPAATAAPASNPRHDITDSRHRRCQHCGHMVTTITVAVINRHSHCVSPLSPCRFAAAAVQCHHNNTNLFNATTITPTPAFSSHTFYPRVRVIRRVSM